MADPTANAVLLAFCPVGLGRVDVHSSLGSGGRLCTCTTIHRKKKKMQKANYIAPEISEIGAFADVTNGVWFGSWRDIFGGRAFIAIG